MCLIWWPFAYMSTAPRVDGGATTSAAQVLSVARHPSASPERLRAVVAGLPIGVLRESWEASSRDLKVASTDATRLALGQLREALLEEMETNHPHSFTRWYRAQCL